MIPAMRRTTAFGALLAVVVACTSPAPATAPAASPTAAPPAATPAEPTASPGGGDGPNVVFLPKQVNNPYFDAAATGAQRAASELGGQFEQVGPSTAASDAQVPYIQDLTTQQVDAIAISATDPDAIVPALQAARTAGIKIVGYDSSPASGAYDVFVNQTDFSLIGSSMAEWACELAPDCTGEIAILSATATAPNQNAWIADMETALEDPQFAGLELVDTVYGDDDPQTSTTQAQGLLTSHPDLKVIVAPTTVGILAAAQVVKQAGKTGEVAVTGLGLPNDMREFVKDGTSPKFGLWSVPDLGYLAYHVAAKLVDGEITGAPGETFDVPGLGSYTIGEDSVVILGPPFAFDADNIDDFDF
jgi:rhamnose transport system substrate-binding protein